MEVGRGRNGGGIYCLSQANSESFPEAPDSRVTGHLRQEAEHPARDPFLSIITHCTSWAPCPDVTQQDTKNRRKQGSALWACRESITRKEARA